MTPLYNISINGSKIWAKLENQNPTGTHKDRSMRPWVLDYADQGVRELAISSSGNSAVSAAKYCSEYGIKLTVFISYNVDKKKISLIRSYKNIFLNITKTPNKDAFQFSKKNDLINLRASRDDKALAGYEAIATELMEQLPDARNIFIPTSSGATLVGIYNGYLAKAGTVPALHIVQTTKVHPIASHFNKNFSKENISQASSIVDNISYRKDGVIKIVEETGGGGYVISKKELVRAKRILHEEACPAASFGELCGGWHSILAFAGFLRWRSENPVQGSKEISVCLFTD